MNFIDQHQSVLLFLLIAPAAILAGLALHYYWKMKCNWLLLELQTKYNGHVDQERERTYSRMRLIAGLQDEVSRREIDAQIWRLEKELLYQDLQYLTILICRHVQAAPLLWSEPYHEFLKQIQEAFAQGENGVPRMIAALWRLRSSQARGGAQKKPN